MKWYVKFVLLLLLTVSIPISYAEDTIYATDEGLIRFTYEETGKQGLMNFEHFVLTDAQFDTIGAFDEYGYALVKHDGKFGMIDRTGNTVIEPEMDVIQIGGAQHYPASNHYGCYMVEKAGKSGFFLVDQRQIIWMDNDQLFFGTPNYYTGKYCVVYSSDHSNYNLLDRKGDTVFADWVQGKVFVFSDGSIVITDSSAGALTYMGRDGENIYTLQLSADVVFGAEDLIAYRTAEGKWGAIDKETGSRLLEPVYQYISESGFADSRLLLEHDGKYGYADRSGKIVIPFQFDYAEDFSCDLAKVEAESGYGFIGTDGQYVIQPVNDDIIWYQSYCKDNVILYSTANREWGYIDQNGDVLSRFQAETQGDFNESYSNLADHMTTYYDPQTQKTGYVNVDGTIALPPQWDAGSAFCEGIATIENNGLCGLIDLQGKQVTDVCFAKIYKILYDQLRLVIRFPLDNHLYLVSFDGDVIAEYLWNDIW